MFFCYKFLLCLLLINVIINICTLEIMSPPKWMTNSRHFKYHNSRWDIWEQIMVYYLGCLRVWLCLALLHYFFHRFLSLNLSLEFLVLLVFSTVLHRKGLLTTPQRVVSPLSFWPCLYSTSSLIAVAVGHCLLAMPIYPRHGSNCLIFAPLKAISSHRGLFDFFFYWKVTSCLTFQGMKA